MRTRGSTLIEAITPKRLLKWLLLAALLQACTTIHYPRRWDDGEPFPPPLPKPSERATTPPSGTKDGQGGFGISSQRIAAVLAFARDRVNSSKSLKVKGKSYRFDCSGFVSAAYSNGGIQLMQLSRHSPAGASGTQIIYTGISERGRLFSSNPRPGDLVFFDNTYDRNRNGKWDDYFTHIGLVNEVLSDGTIILLHLGNSGIKELRMNLAHPTQHKDPVSGDVLNDYLRRRRRSDPASAPFLSAQLFRKFGRLDLVDSNAR